MSGSAFPRVVFPWRVDIPYFWLPEETLDLRVRRDHKFLRTCKVLNNTLAWDIHENYDESECLDLDPLLLYRTCPDVEEPSELFN